ncbi:unnamed protein product [Heligmosomoides polygyrus]|uniref:Small integral membrane protein 14 n=1 Tax=Heligmosomoides polygyrus TaxID=6339 RepID=A0A3P7XAA6_HELPZ|nr:unnamed protein product [Heligmosomoides polygyrus]
MPGNFSPGVVEVAQHESEVRFCSIDHRQSIVIKLRGLRDTQDYCTDSECLTDGGPTAIASNSILLWTMLWGFLALILFFMRPNSMRGGSRGAEKPGPSNRDRVSWFLKPFIVLAVHLRLLPADFVPN